MELIITLRHKQQLSRFLNAGDGIIVGSRFVSGYHYSLTEMEELIQAAQDAGRKVYVVMDNFISEDEKDEMFAYVKQLKQLEVDGIFFHDLGVIAAAYRFDMLEKMIYDGKSALCNTLDSAFMLSLGLESVMISRELTLEEVKEIVTRLPDQVNMQVFGHLRLSYSRRRFLSNYFNEIGKDHDYRNKETLSLVEEQRDYRMPIVEDEAGTMIYTDYILETFRELVELKPYLKRGIIDTIFIDDTERIVAAVQEMKRLSRENWDFIRESYIQTYPDNYSSGYLYQKTNISKNEQD